MFRYRIRTLLIAVGVVGLLLGGAAEWRRRVATARLNAIRSDQFFRLFCFHSLNEQHYEHGEGSMAIHLSPDYSKEKTDAYYSEKYLYHKKLRQKYEAAMERPWLPVAPDPPEPSF